MLFTKPWTPWVVILALLSQHVSSQECDLLDLVLVLDSSNSLTRSDWRNIKNTVSSVVEQLKISTNQIQVGVVEYASSVGATIPITGDKAGLMTAIQNLEKTDTGTGTNLAIEAALRLLAASRPDIADAMVIVTDGSTDNVLATEQQVQISLARNVPIFAIGIGVGISRVDLIKLTGGREDRVNTAASTALLLQTLSEITRTVCQQVVTTAAPTTTSTTTTTTTTTPTPTTTTTTTTPRPTTTTITTTPPPNPCPTGPIDVWFLLDQSEQARVSATSETNFDRLQAALTSFVQNRGVISSPNSVRVGVVAYTSSGSKVVRGLTDAISASTSFTAIIPDPSIGNGNSFTFLGLRTFDTVSVAPGSSTWVVLVSSVDSSAGSNSVTAALSASQLKSRGFKIYAIGIAGPDGTLDERELSQLSSDGTVRRLNTHDQLSAVLSDFGRSKLCLAMAEPPRRDLCGSAKMKDGLGYLYHPTDCDKFIQCHFDNTTGATVAVYRTCPMGQYWDQGKLRCDEACNVDCPEEKCHDTRVEEYPMEGSCRAFWRCEMYKSQPSCCPDKHQYLPGRGCVWNPQCVDKCGPKVAQNEKGPCAKVIPGMVRPVVQFSQDRNSTMFDGPRKQHGHSKDCDHWYSSALLWDSERGALESCTDQFDLVSCQCVRRDLRFQAEKSCRPSTDLQFANASQMTFTRNDLYDLREVTLTKGVASFPGTLGSLLHLNVDDRDGRPLTVALRYRENVPVAKQLYLLRSTRCEQGGWLEVTLNPESVTLKIGSRSGEHTSTFVSKLGFSTSAWKDLNVVYDGNSITLSVRSGKLHYVSRVDAPKVRCFACGVDVAPGSSMESFTGDMESAQVYYCYPQAVTMLPQ